MFNWDEYEKEEKAEAPKKAQPAPAPVVEEKDRKSVV